jgi:hypothetical protein
MDEVEVRRTLGRLKQLRYLLYGEHVHLFMGGFRGSYLLTDVTAKQTLVNTVFQRLRKYSVVVFHRLGREPSLSVSTAIHKSRFLISDSMGWMQLIEAQDTQCRHDMELADHSVCLGGLRPDLDVYVLGEPPFEETLYRDLIGRHVTTGI